MSIFDRPPFRRAPDAPRKFVMSVPAKPLVDDLARSYFREMLKAAAWRRWTTDKTSAEIVAALDREPAQVIDALEYRRTRKACTRGPDAA